MRLSLIKPLVVLALTLGVSSTVIGTAAASSTTHHAVASSVKSPVKTVKTPAKPVKAPVKAVKAPAKNSSPLPKPKSTARLRFGVTTPSGLGGAAELDSVANSVGESPSMVLVYSDFTLAAPISGLDAMNKRGQSVVITWEPWQWGAADQSAYALRNIISGRFDSYITSYAQALQKWGKPVTVRFAHEMNGNWYPWSEGVNGNTTGQYVLAWRHVHDLFTKVKATNVSWMWSPNVPFQGSVALSGLYPGASYVNTVALDGYNFGTTQSDSSWINPSNLFGAGLSQLRSIAAHKPIVIGETASAEVGGSKQSWISSLIPYLASQSDVTGFFWFDQNKETDWRINSSPASNSAFSAALAARR